MQKAVLSGGKLFLLLPVMPKTQLMSPAKWRTDGKTKNNYSGRNFLSSMCGTIKEKHELGTLCTPHPCQCLKASTLSISPLSLLRH